MLFNENVYIKQIRYIVALSKQFSNITVQVLLPTIGHREWRWMPLVVVKLLSQLDKD